MNDLPDMYAQSPRAYVSAKSQVLMLQLLCNTSAKADSLNANTNVTARLCLNACLNDSIMIGKIKHYSNIR